MYYNYFKKDEEYKIEIKEKKNQLKNSNSYKILTSLTSSFSNHLKLSFLFYIILLYYLSENLKDFFNIVTLFSLFISTFYHSFENFSSSIFSFSSLLFLYPFLSKSFFFISRHYHDFGSLQVSFVNFTLLFL